MNIIQQDKLTIEAPGIYFIKNKITNRVYVGSAQTKILKRFNHHLCELRRNNHKNKYLQRSFNKHGEDNFEFIIIENLEKSQCLIREQYYIDNNLNNCYNINKLATGTGGLDKETIDKRSRKIAENIKLASMMYKVFSKEKVNINEIPEKYRKQVKAWSIISEDGFYISGKSAWNKGITKEFMDYSYLKVKKTNSEKLKQSRIRISQHKKDKLPIFVYDINFRFLGNWRNAHELEIESLLDDFKLKENMILRNKEGRNNYSPFILMVFNVQKSCRTGKEYKGLFFKNEPLCQEIGIEKLDKNGEG